MLPPMIIYKWKGIYRDWTGTVHDAEALFARSDKGFTTDNLALEWLHRFDARASMPAASAGHGAPRFYSWVATAPSEPAGTSSIDHGYH